MTAIRKIHPNLPPVNLVFVHVPYCRQCRLRIFEFDKGEATWLAGLEIGYHSYFDDATQFGEGGVELFFGGGEGEISHEDVVFLTGGVLVGGGRGRRGGGGGWLAVDGWRLLLLLGLMPIVVRGASGGVVPHD